MSYPVDKKHFPLVHFQCGYNVKRCARGFEIEWGRRPFADVGERVYRHRFAVFFTCQFWVER